jgi:hypothetical protein
MRVVLQPLNERASDVIVNNVDLLRTPYIDPLLLQASLLHEFPLAQLLRLFEVCLTEMAHVAHGATHLHCPRPRSVGRWALGV